MLDNITLTWLTNTGVSSGRLYWENELGFFDVKGVKVPVALTIFPRELYRAPRSWAEAGLPRTSSTSTRSTRATTSPPGSSRSSSRPRSAPRSGRCAEKGVRHEQHRRDCHRDPPVPGRGPAGGARRPAPPHRRDALAHKELVDDRSQGVQLATIQELARYWATDYDWRKCEAKLNALPQFKTEIDGVDIHFIHVKSPHEDALPLIMTHGWPGSVIELLEVVGPLTDPTAHGGTRRGRVRPRAAVPARLRLLRRADRARLGPRPRRAAWAELMHRLGYTRYVAQGGDVGAAVTDAMGRQAPEGLVGIHINLLVTALGGAPAGGVRAGTRGGRRARHVPGERLRLLPGAGHAAADDRLRPAGFTRRPGGLDARPRHRQLREDLPRLPRRRAGGQSHPGPDRRQHHAVLADGHRGLGGPVVLGERTSPGSAAAGQAPPEVSLPVGFTTFPGEIFQAPRSWVEKAYPNLTYFNEVDKGGHFAAWEEPELFADELRAAFRSLR